MVRNRSVATSIILTIVTCGLYGIYWFIVLTDEVNEVTNEPGTSGGMAFLFNLITCGIYGIYWGYKMGEKLDNSRYRNNVPTGSFPILFLILSLFGLQIIVWAIMQNELNRYTPDLGN